MEALTIDARLLGIFLDDAGRCLAEMRAGLTALHGDKADGLAPLWRGAHNLRGNAAMLGLDTLAELAAAIERFGNATTFAVVRTADAWLIDTIDEIQAQVETLDLLHRITNATQAPRRAPLTGNERCAPKSS